MEKELRDFLQKRGIADDVMLQMENDKIDQNVLSLMTDDQLCQYFPNYGDRIAIAAFAKKPETDNSRNLLDQLREKLGSKKRRLAREHILRSASQCGNKNAKKIERRVELGWLTKQGGEYKQVKSPKGGGVKHLTVSGTCPASSLLDSAINLFFPNGVAKNGEKKTDFTFQLWDNANNIIDSGTTVTELYETLKVKLLRVYMASDKISTRNDTDSVTPQKEKVEPTIHVLTGTPTISFRVRSTDTVGEIEVCPTLDIDANTSGHVSLVDASRKVCAHCSRTYTTESCLMCEQDREFQNSLLIDQQRMSSALPRASFPDMDNSLPDVSVDLTGDLTNIATSVDFTGDLANIATNVINFFSGQQNSQSSEISVEPAEQEIHEHPSPDITSVETFADISDEVRRQRLSFFERNSDESRQARAERPFDTTSENETSLEVVLQTLYQQVDVEGRKNIVNVDRYAVLEGGFRAFQRKSFKENNLLSVKFSGECAVDNGGPSREFLNLSIKSLKNLNIFEGDSDARVMSVDYKAMDSGVYQTAGKMIAYSIVHKGPLPNFMHPLLYKAISYGPDSVKPTVKDVADYEIRQTLQEIMDETRDEAIIEKMNKLEDVAAVCGCLPLAKMDTKEKFVECLCHFLVIGRAALPLQRFSTGLETLNVLASIKKHPAAFEDAFVFNKNCKVSAEKVEGIFKVEINSLEGSNHHRMETRALTMWRDFLQDLEEEDLIGNLLRFVTCMETIPPLGFDPEPKIFFGHADMLSPDDKTVDFPYANTCANTIRLPVLDSYEKFKNNMMVAMEIVTTFTNE